MGRFIWALVAAVALSFSFGAHAVSTVDVGAPSGPINMDVDPAPETDLYVFLNGLLGTTFTSNADLDDGLVPGFSIVDVDDFAAGGPLFDLERQFTFDIRVAGAHHRLSAVSRIAGSQVLFNFGTNPVSGPVTVGAGVTSPFDLHLGVDRTPFNNPAAPDYTLSSDYTSALNSGSEQVDTVQMLLFDVRGLGLGFDYVFAWEDRLDTDFDYNDFIGTITLVPVPPAFGLLGLGMAAVAGLRMRRAKKA